MTEPMADSGVAAEAFKSAVEAAYWAGLQEGLTARATAHTDAFTRGYLSGLVRNESKPACDYFGDAWVQRIVDHLVTRADIRLVDFQAEQIDGKETE